MLTRPVLIAASVLLALLAVSIMTGIAFLSDSVYLYDGDNTQLVRASAKDTDKVLAKAGVTLSPYDKLELVSHEDGTDHLYIKRAFAVNVTADLKTVPLQMAEGTVAQALELAQVSLGADDVVNFSLETPVSKDMDIQINRVTYRESAQTAPVSYDTKYTYNSKVKKGATTVLSPGENGVETTVILEKLVDGQVAQSDIQSRTITTEPKDKVVEIGTKADSVPSQLEVPASLSLDENGTPLSYSRVVSGKAAAYSAPQGSKTSTGRTVQPGYVAVNPNVIPYGTKLYIVSKDRSYVYGYAIAADTGTALMNGKIVADLFMNTNQECLRFGIKNVDIYILD